MEILLPRKNSIYDTRPEEQQCLVLVLGICVEVVEVEMHTKEVDPVHGVNLQRDCK